MELSLNNTAGYGIKFVVRNKNNIFIYIQDPKEGHTGPQFTADEIKDYLAVVVAAVNQVLKEE